ncbi:MAG: DUF3368 domain-containing protein [Bacteroidota bacterium]
MPKTIISDASCFIVLAKIGELDLLKKMYSQVITTTEVATDYGQQLPAWVKIKSPTDRYRQQILEIQLDKGEASVIALATETPESTIILDDYKARMIAEKLRLQITGTTGILIKAKLRGTISSIKPFLEKSKKLIFD